MLSLYEVSREPSRSEPSSVEDRSTTFNGKVFDQLEDHLASDSFLSTLKATPQPANTRFGWFSRKRATPSLAHEDGMAETSATATSNTGGQDAAIHATAAAKNMSGEDSCVADASTAAESSKRVGDASCAPSSSCQGGSEFQAEGRCSEKSGSAACPGREALPLATSSEDLREYVMVERDDAVDAIAHYLASCVMALPEAQNMTPRALQIALHCAMRTLKQSRLQYMASCSTSVYRWGALSLSALQMYKNPWLSRAVLRVLWRTSHLSFKILRASSSYRRRK